MKSAVLLAASLAVFAASARADDPPAAPPVKRAKAVEPRKFENAKLVDPYWGVSFELAGLEEKKDAARAGILLAAKSGRLQVEIAVWEHADALSSKERRDADKKKWEEKKRIVGGDWAQGDDPVVWATYTGEAPSGAKRFEGFAWYVRGCRTFVVHSYALLDVEGGADAVKGALGKLVVGPETGGALQAWMIARQNGLPFDDPGVLHAAAAYYVGEPKNAETFRPAVAEELALRAVEGIPSSRFEKNFAEIFHFHETLATAQMRTKKYDDSLATWAKCAAMAQKTDTPGPDGAIVQFNVACCCSLAGRLDEAFAALDKAWARAADWGPPVSDENLKKDPDLENCRKDPRWEKFLAGKPVKKTE